MYACLAAMVQRGRDAVVDPLDSGMPATSVRKTSCSARAAAVASGHQRAKKPTKFHRERFNIQWPGLHLYVMILQPKPQDLGRHPCLRAHPFPSTASNGARNAAHCGCAQGNIGSRGTSRLQCPTSPRSSPSSKSRCASSAARASERIPTDDLYRSVAFDATARDVLAAARVLLNVQPPTREEVDALATGAVAIGFLAARTSTSCAP